MILVRQHEGALYFLGREHDEPKALRRLTNGFPGHEVQVVFRRQGLLIARVGTPAGPPGREPWQPEFAAVNLAVPAAERLHP